MRPTTWRDTVEVVGGLVVAFSILVILMGNLIVPVMIVVGLSLGFFLWRAYCIWSDPDDPRRL